MEVTQEKQTPMPQSAASAGSAPATQASAGKEARPGAASTASTPAGAIAGGKSAAAEPFIVAEGLGLRSPLGKPFSDVNLQIPLGSFVAVTGEHGAGKTPLILTLAGRMKFNRGSLTVGGHKLPRGGGKVRRMAGLGLFAGLNELETNLKVHTVMAAELELFKKRHRKDDVQAYLDDWDLGHTFNMRVRELSEPEMVRLGIALGMASDPKILAVDDVEHSLNHEQTRELVSILDNLAHTRNMIVLVALTEPSFAEGADQIVSLERSK